MPKHEPEVLAAIRRRKPLGRVVIDDDFAGTADGEQVLCCPRCGYQYMHSGKIYTSCDSKGSSTHIAFECERYGPAAEFELVITDYKGNVFVE
jgi:hypothetical protein